MEGASYWPLDWPAARFFSQAPEFAQQYRQRIGGAIDELRIIVDDFTKQAADHHLDRQQALDVYARSPDDFLRDRGLSMRSTLERYERLVTQQSDLGRAAPAPITQARPGWIFELRIGRTQPRNRSRKWALDPERKRRGFDSPHTLF